MHTRAKANPAVGRRERRERRRWKEARVKDGRGVEWRGVSVGGRRQTEGRASESGLT